MLILTIKTDKSEAEVGLFSDSQKLGYCKWQAGRQLSVTIHEEILKLLKSHQFALDDLGGIIVFKGPGSFTGLRIGISTANALAFGLNRPIVAGMGRSWIKRGISLLNSGQNDCIVKPEYGSPVHITRPRK
jgi:tRNA threonylcarbamoyladenosine biosynthesis protein TsaB